MGVSENYINIGFRFDGCDLMMLYVIIICAHSSEVYLFFTLFSPFFHIHLVFNFPQKYKFYLPIVQPQQHVVKFILTHYAIFYTCFSKKGNSYPSIKNCLTGIKSQLIGILYI